MNLTQYQPGGATIQGPNFGITPSGGANTFNLTNFQPGGAAQPGGDMPAGTLTANAPSSGTTPPYQQTTQPSMNFGSGDVGSGASAGAGIGFLVGGPAGALLGAGIGAGVGAISSGIKALYSYYGMKKQENENRRVENMNLAMYGQEKREREKADAYTREWNEKRRQDDLSLQRYNKVVNFMDKFNGVLGQAPNLGAQVVNAWNARRR